MPDMTERPGARRRRRPAAAARRRSEPERRAKVRPAPTADDRFFRHIVNSMRNGVIAFRRNGVLALMNDEAYRIFGLTARRRAISDAPSPTCFATGPTSSACWSSAFELSYLPNRAELRLKDLDRVIGYTLSQVKDDAGAGRLARCCSSRT